MAQITYEALMIHHTTENYVIVIAASLPSEASCVVDVSVNCPEVNATEDQWEGNIG